MVINVIVLILVAAISFKLGFLVKSVFISVLANEAAKGDSESIAIMEKYRQIGHDIEKRFSR